MTLVIDIKHRLGSFLLDARFETGSGLVTLFGRSGSGKTSIINTIAGLIRPDKGRVTINGTVLVDTARGIFLPRHRRRIGYVFQEGRLFPHLTVRQNLLYGRWFAQPAARDDLDRVVDLLGIGSMLERRPGRLSGGEKQRVAIGRALLANPRLLLMDEPLASLDEARKAEILPYIERLRDQIRVPIVYVSHSIVEVTRLASTLVLLSEGKVAAVGPTTEIMHRLDLFPLTGRAEAGAIVEATVERHDERFALTELRSRAGLWRLPRLDAPVGARLRLRVRARDVMLAKSAPTDLSALNVLPGTVADIGAREGPIVEVRLDCSGEALIARLTRYSVERLGLVAGAPVFALIKSVALDRRSLSGPMRVGSSADAEANDT
ncbi:MAG: molybdenum ABC transporter ATP-binding protein [Hyphomonadaceae bacterium]|jgi:molybdate transport system ATP-binding protein|nr:molybdenum ABC transporter ATP-binding protein [Hyphomonadaceae bacterium]